LIALRPAFAIARADFQERTRRYSFFLALLFAVFLGYAAATGKIFLQFDDFRGVYTSGWIGTLVALVITCFVSLIGFYVVKNSVERDRSTGVGQILAATPLSKTTYAFGKFLSNFAVLSSMVAILALAALVMQFWVAEDAHIDLWALLSPFLLIALPTIALTAALALCFEMLPLLRGGFGNVAWFFVWSFGLAAPAISKRPWLDPTGLVAVMNSLAGEVRRYVPNYHGGMSFQIDIGQHMQVVQAWRSHGISWNAQSILLRFTWLAVACAIALFAALVFDRFDSDKSARAVKPARFSKRNSSATLAQQESSASGTILSPQIHLTPLAGPTRSTAFSRIFFAELRLALFGRRWWWYLVAIGLLIAEFSSPLEISRGPLLASAWMWAVFVWSPMGARESRFSTRQLLFCCANILPRQLLACFLAGLSVAFLTGAGTAVRLAIAGDSSALLAWLAGALLLPAFALFLGIASGTSKPFEALLTMLWYVGPMNHTPGLDFTGSANGPHTTSYALTLLALAVVLLLSGFALRSTQLRSL
jgi:hypothetical protein